MTRRLVILAALTATMAAAPISALSFAPALPSASCKDSRRSLHVLSVMSSMLNEFGASHDSLDDDDDDRPQPHMSLPHGVHAPVIAINSPQALADFLNQDDRLCVIKFHAAWCKSCQRFGRKFQVLANQNTDWIQDSGGSLVKSGGMRFGSIEFGANTGMCRTLNIQRLPTVHFYQKGQQLDGFPCGPSKFPRLVETVQYLLQRQVQDDKFAATMRQGEELMSSGQVTEVLQQLLEQEANGTLESKSAQRKTKKAWWNPMP